MKRTKIKGGYFHNGKGKQFTVLQDALANDTKCGCGINCKDGFISLPSFDSVTGDKEGFHGFYFVDGELVTDTVPNIKEELKSFCNGGGQEPQALRLTFDSIENANTLVGDASDVNDWNTFFDLPTYGTPFTSVEVVGNEVRLFGGSNIVVREYAFVIDPNDPYNSPQVGLVSIDDSSDSIIEVQEGAFCYSNTLTSINLPACTLISENTQQFGAFQDCINLSTVNIPLLEEAYYSAFYNCSSLTEINFPLLTTAGNYCFGNINNMNIINLPSLISAGVGCFYYCTSLTTVDLPSLTTAETESFSDCTSLTTVNFPSLTVAGDNCFYYCTSLTTINLPSCVNLGGDIGYSDVFYNIIGNTINLTINLSILNDADLIDLSLNNNIIVNGNPYVPFSGYIGDLTIEFNNISNADVLVGDASDVNDWNTFFDLPDWSTEFTSVTIVGNSVTLIGGENIALKDSKFVSNTNIISVVDTGCVVYIGSNCFAANTNLVTINFPSLTVAGDNCFPSCDLTTVDLPVLTVAGGNFFNGCTSLTTIDLPSLTIAGDACFQNCSSLTNANLPVLTTAGNYCFIFCPLLTTVNLPNLTTAGDGCFYDCNLLTTVNLPNLTTTGIACFSDCTSLTTVNLPSLITAYDQCFDLCTSLTTVNLPNLITAGGFCFRSCPLTTIDLPSLTTVGDSFFEDCTSLTAVNIPSCTNLGGTIGDDNVFYGISGNTITLTVPSALMTANAGSPDGDIAYLQANNTVTIITV